MELKVVVTPTAWKDLEQVAAFIGTDNPEAAERLCHELLDQTEPLAVFPQMGWVPPDLRHLSVREVVHRNYRIVYRIMTTKQEIYILRFWHSARGTPHL